MLKLTLKPGDYLDIGENIKVIYSGGSSNNIHLLIEAPKEISVKRNKYLEKENKKSSNPKSLKTYVKETGISEEARKEIVKILMQEKKKGNNAKA